MTQPTRLVPDRREPAPRHAPQDAAIEGLRRIASNTVEKRLRNARGLPNFGISFYVLDKQGRHAGVAMYPGGKYAVCDGNGGRQLAMEALFEGKPGD